MNFEIGSPETTEEEMGDSSGSREPLIDTTEPKNAQMERANDQHPPRVKCKMKFLYHIFHFNVEQTANKLEQSLLQGLLY